MPKTPVHENGKAVTRQHEVRPAFKIADVKPEAVSQPVD